MNHHWQIVRISCDHPDAQRRWDRAYQLLMAWSSLPTAAPDPPDAHLQEAPHEHECLCSRIDTSSSPDPDH